MLTLLRTLRRAPLFTFTAALGIALGVGVNTAVFSVIERVLLDPLPYRDPARLVHLAQTHPDFPGVQVTAPDFVDWQQRAKSFDAMAGYTFQAMNKWRLAPETAGGEPMQIQVVQASASLFPMLGVTPVLGRPYTAEEERGKTPVVLISERLWRGRFGADPQIVGRKITLVDWPVTVVGVVGQRQALPAWTDVWMGLGFLDPALTGSRRFHPLEVVGRLRAGVSVAQARTEMAALARALAAENPQMNRQFGAAVEPLDAWMTGETRPLLWMAWAAVSLVFFLACANVAHLVLVRNARRWRELAIRATLGATSSRLAAWLLTENVAVAALGAALGLALAHFSLALLTVELPRLERPELSLSALAFGFAAALLAGVLVAVPSLWRIARADLHGAMKPRASRWGTAILAAEIALALVVLTGAGLLYRSFALVMSEKPGFEAAGVVAIEWGNLAKDWEASRAAFEQRVEPAIRALPGVTQVAAVNTAPMALRRSDATRYATRFALPGRPGEVFTAQMRWITPEYFATLRIPVLSGRAFERRDRNRVLVNQAFVRRYLAGVEPVGARVTTGVNTPAPQAIEVIGVVGDVRDLWLDAEPAPTLYSPDVSNGMTILVRGGDPVALRAAVRAATPDAMVRTVGALTAVVEESVALRRFALNLLLGFALLAAALTALGVYGVVSDALAARRGEFALRLALGAGPGDLRRAVARGYAAPVAAGVVAGLAGSGWGSVVLESQLYRTARMEPSVLAWAVFALVALVVLAAWRPLRRAVGTSPALVLRDGV